MSCNNCGRAEGHHPLCPQRERVQVPVPETKGADLSHLETRLMSKPPVGVVGNPRLSEALDLFLGRQGLVKRFLVSGYLVQEEEGGWQAYRPEIKGGQPARPKDNLFQSSSEAVAWVDDQIDEGWGE
jgi:hypothetical protein